MLPITEDGFVRQGDGNADKDPLNEATGSGFQAEARVDGTITHFMTAPVAVGWIAENFPGFSNIRDLRFQLEARHEICALGFKSSLRVPIIKVFTGVENPLSTRFFITPLPSIYILADPALSKKTSTRGVLHHDERKSAVARAKAIRADGL